MKSILKMATIALALSLTTPAFAEYVQYLGETRINKSLDTDSIGIHSCRELGARVSHIRFHVLRSGMTIYGLRMFYGQNMARIINQTAFFPEGSRSGWIPVSDGRAVCLREVAITADGRNGIAVVEFEGIMHRTPYADPEIN